MDRKARWSGLERIDLAETDRFGPKAATLGTLMRAGHPVPEGFALSAAWFDAFLEANGFPYAPGDYLGCSSEIRTCLDGYELGADLSEAIAACVAGLRERYPASRLIVRTSALCEDTGRASLAGMFESFPDLEDLLEVSRAVVGCYRSLFSDRALNAVASGIIPAGNLRAGVILQRYVAGEISGVTFTADTKEMDPSVLVVSAVRGPCSRLTMGSVTPTAYFCDKTSLRVLRVAGGQDLLGDELLRRVIESALAIEKLAGRHQDIEWTFAGDRLHVLQARPVTGFRKRMLDGEWTIEPADPFGRVWSLRCGICLPPLVAELAVANTNSTGQCAYDRGMHWDSVTGAIRHGHLYEAPRPIPDQKGRLDAYLALLQRQWDQGVDEFADHVRPELSALIEGIRRRYVGRELSKTELLSYLDEAERYLKRSAELHWRVTTSEWYLGHFFRQRIGKYYDRIGAQDLVDMVYGRSMMIAEREELYRIVARIRESGELLELFTGFRHDAIIEARLLRMETEDARGLLEQVRRYGREYGWLQGGNLEGDRLPRPGDVPLRECIARLRRYLRVDFDAYRANLAQIREQRDRLRAIGRLRCTTPEERESFDRAIAVGEKAFLAGDDHAYFICSKKNVFVCDALWRIAERFAEEGIIDVPEDIHFLCLREVRDYLKRGGSAREVVDIRKREHEARSLLLPPKKIGENPAAGAPSDPQAASVAETSVAKIVKGESGTRKDARGRLHVGFPATPPEDDVVLLLEHGHEGDITTILGCLRGIIVKMGTPASHMGIIARELGIPAVYGVGKQADLLVEGQTVEIRGETGEVVPLPPDAHGRTSGGSWRSDRV